jgi:GntR family transcriptional regulator
MIDRQTPIPLYFQMAEDIRQKILSGDYLDGAKLPSEQELCKAYGVSRSVVRQALQSLSRDGLIATERGRGAFVHQRRVPITLSQRLDPLEKGMRIAGFELRTEILENKRIQVPEAIAEKIGENQAVYLKRVRYADGVIFLVVENYLPLSRSEKVLESEDLDQVSLYVFLEENCGIVVSTGRRHIQIRRVPDEFATLLELTPGDRVLYNQEITFDESGSPVEYYESWHHPERTELDIKLDSGTV